MRGNMAAVIYGEGSVYRQTETGAGSLFKPDDWITPGKVSWRGGRVLAGQVFMCLSVGMKLKESSWIRSGHGEDGPPAGKKVRRIGPARMKAEAIGRQYFGC